MTIENQQNAADGSTSTERGGIAGTVRRRAIDAYDNARGSVSGAGRRAEDAIDEAPLIALAGGLAAGALLAALLPRTRGEEQLFRPMGEKLTGTARAAASAARSAVLHAAIRTRCRQAAGSIVGG